VIDPAHSLDSTTLWRHHHHGPHGLATSAKRTRRKPQRRAVNGVNVSADDPRRLLREALDAVPAPPLQRTDPAAVHAWVEAVRAGVGDRRELRRAARAIEQAIWEEYLTAEQVRREQEREARHHMAMEARADGSYWAAAEARRTAQRPTHVDVDSEAWKAVRQLAVHRGIAVGRLVGEVVVREAQRLGGGGAPLSELSGRRGPSGAGRRAQRFARLEVNLGPWTTVRVGAIAANITLARYVGLLVESSSDASRTA